MNPSFTNQPQAEQKKTKILIEMRPALEGYAGIPQETRLLVSNISKLAGYEVEGLLQGPNPGQNLSKGIRSKKNPKLWATYSHLRRYETYSNVIISFKEKPYRSWIERVINYWRNRSETLALRFSILTGYNIKLTNFTTKSFEDFIWRTLYAKTLPSSEFARIIKLNYKILSVSWYGMQMSGLFILRRWISAIYPRINLGDADIFIGQTPYPGRVLKRTKLIIRYHDAIPVFYPHTINDASSHQAQHVFALGSNVRNGAWFSCVSEATRQDLIKLYPNLEKKSVVIHNTVSPHYYREDTSFERVRGIIRSRIYGFDPDAKGLGVSPEFLNLREQEAFFRRNLFDKEFKYLLVVSTIEPRKNHSRALAAWEILKEEIDPSLKLVIVGTLGWGYKEMVKGLRTWIDRGELFMLNSVPAPDLRVLYRHASATVCPSLQEGFDFSGVEAMRSGGIAVASDIPVHREIYGDAAEYFDPYSTKSTVDCLKRVLYSPEAAAMRERLEKRGDEISSRYLPDQILPQWEVFLEKVKNS